MKTKLCYKIVVMHVSLIGFPEDDGGGGGDHGHIWGQCEDFVGTN